MKIPTLKVSDGAGSYMIINQDDFDSSIHTPYKPAAAAAASRSAAAPSVPKSTPKPAPPELGSSPEPEASIETDSESKPDSESVEASVPSKSKKGKGKPDFDTAARTTELEAMAAGEVRAIAEKLGIARPRSGGWAAAIPAIVQKEAEG